MTLTGNLEVLWLDKTNVGAAEAAIMPHCAPGALSPHSLRGLSRPSRDRRRHPRVPRFLSRLPLIVREPSVINLLDLLDSPVVVVVVRALDVTQRLRGRQCTVGHDGYNFTAWPGRAS